MDIVQALTDWIRREGALGNLIVSLAIVVAIWLVRHLALRTTLRRLDAPARYRWRRASFHLAVSLALVLVALIWLGGYRNVALHLGIVTAGLAIALQELIESFAAWLFIEWRRPFTVGDRIQIGERCGDVIDLTPFQFALAEIGAWIDGDESTGRIIWVPNSMVFTEFLTNYSRPGLQYVWDEVVVHITFDSDWRRARQILEGLLKDLHATLPDTLPDDVERASRRYFGLETETAPAVYTRVDDRGILLSARYLSDLRRRRRSQHILWEGILSAIEREPHITFAYPTRRIYHSPAADETGIPRPPAG
ncbi:MAG TPA: mechanosensitive ion channel [Chloroflexi bacterium]|jgi:small-conductance mechanosensitive channel|nr:mechanosensitive ion channel [Chloroflexota bacterium]